MVNVPGGWRRNRRMASFSVGSGRLLSVVVWRHSFYEGLRFLKRRFASQSLALLRLVGRAPMVQRVSGRFYVLCQKVGGLSPGPVDAQKAPQRGAID